MDVHFNIRKELNFQWNNFEIEDIFSIETLLRSFDLLLRSGELVETTKQSNTNKIPRFFGYGEPTIEQGKQVLNELIAQHVERAGQVTPFSNIQRKQLVVLNRIYLALLSRPSSVKQAKRRKIKPSQQRTVEETASTLVQIGVKAGLPLLFALIKRSWERNDSLICTEVFSTANDILLSLAPLSLYNYEISPLGIDSMERVSKFLKTAIVPSASSALQDKQLGGSILLELVSQRGLLRGILDCVQFIFENRISLDLSADNVELLLSWFNSAKDQLNNKGTKRSQKESDEVGETNRPCDTFINHFQQTIQKCKRSNSTVALLDTALAMLAYIDRLTIHYLPKREESSKQVKVSNEPTAVYMWGSNSNGQLAEAPSSSAICEPLFVASFSAHNPVQIELGSHCSTILTEDGSVYSCGKGEYGRLGIGSTESRNTLTLLHAFKTHTIRKIAVSRSSYGHGLAIDENNEIWSWGDGDYGKLGHGDTVQCSVPKRIEALRGKHIVAISCGYKHSACLTVEGEMYTWGLGDYGRLGHGNSDNLRVPKKVDFGEDVRIGGIACGSAHTLAISEDGETVWSWGDGDFGKLGHSDSNVKRKPEVIEALRGLTIVKVEGGDEISLALTGEGRVYSWGKGDSFLLGHDSQIFGNVTTPTLVKPLEPWQIVDVRAGGHCVALSSEGDVFTWGLGEGGVLGHGNTNNVSKPTLVTSLQGRSIKQIAAGSQHTAAWTVEPLDRVSTSKVRGTEKAPYCIDVHRETFLSLRCLLERFAVDPSKPTPPFTDFVQQQYLIIACLNILRTNLFHVTAVGIDPNEVGLSTSSDTLVFFRDQLLRLLNSVNDRAIQQAVQETFEVGWGVLLPTSQERRIMLASLLPRSGQSRLEFSEAQQFLGELLVNSILEDHNLIDFPRELESSPVDISVSAADGDTIIIEFSADVRIDSPSAKESSFVFLDSDENALVTVRLLPTGILSFESAGIESSKLDVQLDRLTIHLSVKLLHHPDRMEITLNQNEPFSLYLTRSITELDRVQFLGSGTLLSFEQHAAEGHSAEHIDLLLTLMQCIERQNLSKLSQLDADNFAENLDKPSSHSALVTYLCYLQKHLLRLFGSDKKNTSVLVFQHSTRVLGAPCDLVTLVLRYSVALIDHCCKIIDFAYELASKNPNAEYQCRLVETLRRHSAIHGMLPQLLLSLQIANKVPDRISPQEFESKDRAPSSALQDYEALTSKFHLLLERLDALNHILPIQPVEQEELTWGGVKVPVDKQQQSFQWIVNVERLLASLLGSWVSSNLKNETKPKSDAVDISLTSFQIFPHEPTSTRFLHRLAKSEYPEFISRLIALEARYPIQIVAPEAELTQVLEPLISATFACIIKFQNLTSTTEDICANAQSEIPEEIFRVWLASKRFAHKTLDNFLKAPTHSKLSAATKFQECVDLCVFLVDEVIFHKKPSVNLIPDFPHNFNCEDNVTPGSMKAKKIFNKFKLGSSSKKKKSQPFLLKHCFELIFQGVSVQEIQASLRQQEHLAKMRLAGLKAVVFLISRKGLLRSVQLQILRASFLPAEEYFAELKKFTDEAPVHLVPQLLSEIELIYSYLVQIMQEACDSSDKANLGNEHFWILLCVLRILGTRYFIFAAVKAGVLDVLYQLLRPNPSNGDSKLYGELQTVGMNYLRILIGTIATSKEEYTSTDCLKVIEVVRLLVRDSLNQPADCSNPFNIGECLGFLRCFAVAPRIQLCTSSKEWTELLLDIITHRCLSERLMAILLLKETLLSWKTSARSSDEFIGMLTRLYECLSNNFNEQDVIPSCGVSQIITDGCAFNRDLLHKATIEGNDQTFRQSRSAEINNTGFVIGTSGASQGVHRWTVKSHHDARSDETLCVGVATLPLGSTNLESTNNMWLYRAYNGVLYHGGKRGSIERFTIGDEIGIEVDMNKHTLSYYKNGKLLGTAFDNLPNVVYPIILFYATSTRARASFIRYSYTKDPKFEPQAQIPFGSSNIAFRMELIYLIRELLEKPDWRSHIVGYLSENLHEPGHALSVLATIGFSDEGLYRIGSRVFHEFLGLGTVMDVTSGDPPSITVYYDSGCSAVLPTHYVKLQYGASFNGAWFEAPQASLEFIVDHASDPTSKLYTNANRALRKLLPVWQKKAWQSAKISSFLSTIANSAVSSTNLISRFNSSQLERLVWFCLRSSSVVSESNSEKQESLPNDPNTEISVECLELIKPSEDSLQMSASDKPSVENDSSLEQFVETLQAVPETNPVPPVPAAKEDFSDEAFRGMFTSVILFDSVPAPQVKLSALQNDALEGLSKEDLLKTFSEENLEHLSKSELSLLIQKAPPEFLAKLTEILQGALQITFAREILLDVLQSSTSPMPEIYVDLMRKFYLLFRLVSAGRVSGYPRKFVKPIIRRMIANGASPEFDPVRFFHTQALAELLHLVVGYEQRAHQLKSDLVPPDYEMLYILLRVLKTRAEPTLVGELFLIVEHKLPQTVKALLLQEACNLIKTANLASSRVLEDILESVKQSESQPFERMIPKIAFSTFENLGGSASKKSICSYSPFFQSLLSIMLCLPAAWQYEGEPLLGPRWDWWNEYSLSIQTYWALKNRSEFPSGFIKSVRGLLREIDLFDENETLMCLDNFYWSKQMDQQLVRWTTEHPEDWSRPIDVYLFGCGHSGQLAEASDPFKTHPVYVDSFALIQPTQVSCGSMCTFALAEDGSVHCCGKGEYGRLGTGSNDNQRTLTQLTSIQNIIIKRLSASKGSYGHTLAVDETGQIWSWGDGDYGKLGHGNSTQCPKPKPIEALRGKFITRVACGFKHSACVTLEGELYTWGMGDYGRLGHGGANETQNLPKRVEALSNTLIVEVACGSAHTLAVADNRTSVYSWGDGDYGKLGHGDTNGKTLPTLIELLSVYTIKRVEAGDEFSVALTDSGRVLSWGRNNANVLGHGDEGHLNVPLIITTLEPFTIIEISVGASHCIALTDQRRVYTWGSNEDGQLGLGHKNPVNVPQLVESLKNKKVRQVSAGSSHSAVWTSEPIDGRQSISLPFVIPLEYTLIQHVPIKQIAQRLSLLQHFSDMTLNNLVFCNVEQSILGLGLDELPKYLLPKSKTTVLRKQLSKTAYFDADITIQLDGCTEDIFTAMFLQLATLDPKELRASSRPYKIRFDGDLADDYDGIQEECMDQLQVGSGGLLQVTPNGINETGVNRDVQIFSNENVNQKLAKFRFFGRILGSAIRTKVPTQLYLAHVVYEMLAGKKLDLEDLREIDCDSLNCLEFIRTIEQFNVDRHNFHDIVPSNYFPPLINEHFEQVELHFDTRHEYVRLALEKHLNSWKIPTQQVWLGIRDIVPVPLLHLLTARDLEEYIAVPYSGSDGLVWEDLPLTCEVQGFPSDPEYEIEPVETDPGNLAGNPLMHIYLKYKKGSKHIENRKHRLLVWFWDAVEKFTSYEKGLFCRMVGGSTRPYWERLVIRYQASGLPEETIPFSPELYTLILPNYSSEVDLVRNLRKALHRV